MTGSSSSRMNIFAFLAIVTLSAGTMLWLFWRFPLTTAVITVGVFRRSRGARAACPVHRCRHDGFGSRQAAYLLESVGKHRHAACAALDLASGRRESRYLADTKAAENLAEQVIAAELAGDFTQRKLGAPQTPRRKARRREWCSKFPPPAPRKIAREPAHRDDGAVPTERRLRRSSTQRGF